MHETGVPTAAAENPQQIQRRHLENLRNLKSRLGNAKSPDKNFNLTESDDQTLKEYARLVILPEANTFSGDTLNQYSTQLDVMYEELDKIFPPTPAMVAAH